ncbi:hypothetical protein NDU88_003430 [Pleurodeles waltl]|uniref:Uncharacterized protein n=1 Tax=Pleurodeles waltl TaxID=8319 RepID=A0AAV7TP54_PLEWA|nr:hypothetical protein NDU88_003430 [Pleurodeles waltl]
MLVGDILKRYVEPPTFIRLIYVQQRLCAVSSVSSWSSLKFSEYRPGEGPAPIHVLKQGTEQQAPCRYISASLMMNVWSTHPQLTQGDSCVHPCRQNRHSQTCGRLRTEVRWRDLQYPWCSKGDPRLPRREGPPGVSEARQLDGDHGPDLCSGSRTTWGAKERGRQRAAWGQRDLVSHAKRGAGTSGTS